MCLAVPAKIIDADKHLATVDIMGVREQINIDLIHQPRPGMLVLVHAGFAIQTINTEAYHSLHDLLTTLTQTDALDEEPNNEL